MTDYNEMCDLIRDMDYCIRIRQSCDQCEIRPCSMGVRVAELLGDTRKKVGKKSKPFKAVEIKETIV